MSEGSPELSNIFLIIIFNWYESRLDCGPDQRNRCLLRKDRGLHFFRLVKSTLRSKSCSSRGYTR